MQIVELKIKGILSTTIVIFSYPKLLSMNSIKRRYLRGKQTRILTSMLQHPDYWHKIDKNRFVELSHDERYIERSHDKKRVVLSQDETCVVRSHDEKFIGLNHEELLYVMTPLKKFFVMTQFYKFFVLTQLYKHLTTTLDCIHVVMTQL